MKGIKHYIEYVNTKAVKMFKEKTFEENSTRIKYMLVLSDSSKDLIVVFSACTRSGVKARYNYVRTLKDTSINKLFILDDFASDKRGAYYLGHAMGNEIETACNSLIKEIVDKHQIDKLIMCGSSKGGWAALNIMSSFPGSVSIIGAPQYKLGNYLMEPPLKTTRDYVLGIDASMEQQEVLNEYLKNKLFVSRNDNHKIYLHYSNMEHTYKEHVAYLIEDLNTFGYKVVFDKMNYEEHGSISKYFPNFLLTALKEIKDER